MDTNHVLDLRPRRDTKTGRVWEIADAISSGTGRMASRGAVISAYVAEGGNINTAATQYAAWRKDYHRRAPTSQSPVHESAERVSLRVESDGRLLIPHALRARMGLVSGGMVSARIEDGELRLIAPRQALARLQRLVRELDQGEGSAADELIAERREEAKSE